MKTHTTPRTITSQTPNQKQQPTKKKHPNKSKTKTPVLLFTPTKELITDTYKLSTIARDMGMNLHPAPSLSHIIFSYPSSKFSSLSFSSSLSLPIDAIPLPFPSLITASSTHLHSFANLSKGLFKLVYLKHNDTPNYEKGRISNWESCGISLFCRVSGERVSSMDSFCRVLAGMGWALFKSKEDVGERIVYLYRKVERNRVWARRGDGEGDGVGEYRIRELRLPLLDFRNAPLRILQYIILMTDDIFYLA